MTGQQSSDWRTMEDTAGHTTTPKARERRIITPMQAGRLRASANREPLTDWMLDGYTDGNARLSAAALDLAYTVEVLATQLAERDAEISRVRAKADDWETEIDEQTRAKEFGIAEGLRVARQDTLAALAGVDQPEPKPGNIVTAAEIAEALRDDPPEPEPCDHPSLTGVDLYFGPGKILACDSDDCDYRESVDWGQP